MPLSLTKAPIIVRSDDGLIDFDALVFTSTSLSDITEEIDEIKTYLGL